MHVECDWKRHWPTREQILSKRQSDRSPSLPPSPKNQHRRHSRSQRLHHPVLLRRCQHKLSERADGFTNGVGTTRTQRTRPRETPTSEISGRPVVKARPASSPMIVPTAEGSGTVVLSAHDDWWFIRDRWNRRCGNSRPRGGCVAV